MSKWILSVDGSSNLKGSGSGNQAEYEVVIVGLKLAKEVRFLIYW